MRTPVIGFSLRFSGHFPGERGLAGVYWIPVRHSGGPLGLTLTLTMTPGMGDLRNGGRYCLLKQRIMEVVVTTGAIGRAKLQSNHHQQTNTQFFTGRMPFLSPNHQCQSTEGKISHPMDLLTPSSPGVFQLCL